LNGLSEPPADRSAAFFKLSLPAYYTAQGLPNPLSAHACGFALANKGHDTRALQAYLGHKNIQHTVRYTELAPTRFKDFWRD
jgi:site-specific recombinase XerD